jgi:hypothetical protein
MEIYISESDVLVISNGFNSPKKIRENLVRFHECGTVSKEAVDSLI